LARRIGKSVARITPLTEVCATDSVGDACETTRDFARWESAESEAGVTAWACNEKGQDAVELVLAFEGARVVCLPTSDVHWLFNL